MEEGRLLYSASSGKVTSRTSVCVHVLEQSSCQALENDQTQLADV